MKPNLSLVNISPKTRVAFEINRRWKNRAARRDKEGEDDSVLRTCLDAVVGSSRAAF